MVRGGLNHLALTVSDLRASEAAFYAPVLGFLGYERVEEIPETMTLWWNDPAGFAVNLWQAHTRDVPHDRYRPGFHHAAFAAESREAVDDLAGLLAERGITRLEGPAEFPDYAPGYYALFFADPEGMKFEFVHMPAIPA